MTAPALRLEPLAAIAVGNAWRMRWRVTNEGASEVRLVAVRAPHSRFRSDPIDLNVVVASTAIVEQTLRIEAAPGEEIENAFVIFVAVQGKDSWRVLFRVRARIDADGTPGPVVESITTHRVGFSEV